MSTLVKVCITAGIIAALPAAVVCIDNMEITGGMVFVGACILIDSGVIASAIGGENTSAR